MLSVFCWDRLLLYIIHINISLQILIIKLIKGQNYCPRTRNLIVNRQGRISWSLLQPTNFHHSALAWCVYEKDERAGLWIYQQRNNSFLDVQLKFGLICMVAVAHKLMIVVTFDVHGSVHSNINLIESTSKMQPCSRIYYSKFLNCSTCFGRHTTHHQEIKNFNCSFWFYIRFWLPAAAMAQPVMILNTILNS
jgi:hypothetical protein